MSARMVLCASMALVAASMICSSAGRAEEKKAKIEKDQIAGNYLHMPGDRPAFKLKADGSGTMQNGNSGALGLGNWPCRWDFNEHYQMVVVATQQYRRQYKAQMEDGKVVLYEGREVFRKGVNLNAPLVSPLDKAYKADAEAEKKADTKPETKPETP